ncbi:hypothetical protein LSH36_1413g00014 [Paralvinella palmiformis]|uniref:Uncharacterized protein n=1 Tax=Paralvinella palmiformis TaxID=53620 RepID=A0AAD9ITF0_9ANNE|nr:hypothetical protein LSH36_1413g00014 [Paralvinella palmiformis]
MASAVRKVALKSLLLGIFLLACEFAWTYSRRYHLSRQRTQFESGRLYEIPESIVSKERREQFLVNKFARNSPMKLAVGERVYRPNGTVNIRGLASNNNESILPKRISSTDKNILYREHDTVHINLDSAGWSSSDDVITSTMDQVKHALSHSEIQVIIACANPIRHVTFERPVTRLSHGKYVLGHMNRELDRYAVMSVGVDFRTKQTDSYAFYAPLTSLAWKRVDYGVILIVADTLCNWLQLPVTRHVMSYLCQTGAVLFFLPTSKEKIALVGQAAKLFVAPLLNEYYNSVGSEVSGDIGASPNPFLVLADIDLWVLHHHEFATKSNIISLNNGCCQWFEHKGWRLKSWPLSYLGMRMRTWWELLGGNTGIFRKMHMTSYGMVGIFRRRFQDQVKEPMVRGRTGSWYLPDFMVGLWLNSYMMTKGPDHVTFADRPGPRLEPRDLFVNGSNLELSSYFDAHMPRVARISYKNDAWTLVSRLLKYMYGKDSIDMQWCTAYNSKYMNYIKDYQKKMAKETYQAPAVQKVRKGDKSPSNAKPIEEEIPAVNSHYEYYSTRLANPMLGSQMQNMPPQKRRKQQFRTNAYTDYQQRFEGNQRSAPRLSLQKPIMSDRMRRKPGMGRMQYGNKFVNLKVRRPMNGRVKRSFPGRRFAKNKPVRFGRFQRKRGPGNRRRV